MPNIATILKEEIARVARKESREDNQKLKKSSAQYRSDIAALKRRMLALEKLVARLGKPSRRGAGAASASVDSPHDPGTRLRFSAKGLASQRKRLGLSAAEAGAIIGVSGQSIYKWEDAKARPRASQLPGIARLRGMSKKEAAAKLAELAG
jgi:hypothetical protein